MQDPAAYVDETKIHIAQSEGNIGDDVDKKSQQLIEGGAAHLFREDSNGGAWERYLIPRPTNDPNDPLTWSTTKKHLALASISFFVFLSNYVTASIGPVLYPIIVEFEITLQQGTYLITLNILFLGIGNLFWIPLAQKIGKRPVIILSSAIFFAGCIWNAKAASYGSLVASRIIQGFGASSSEALGPAIIADLYFLHERGTKIGFYTLMIAGGSCFGSLFAGLVTTGTKDWRWVFWMDAILTGVSLLLTCLFQAETNFDRPMESETGGSFERGQIHSLDGASKSWIKSLGIFAWYDPEKSWFYLFLRPWAVGWFPAVLWGSLLYGCCLGWVVFQQTANASFFPRLYGFSGLAVGNISISNLIGSLIGCAVAGPLSDYVIAAISKRKNGYFKPEYRLWLLILPFLIFPIGLLLWGAGLQKKLSPYVAIAGAGITYGILCAVPAVLMTYIVDSYRPLAGETITIMTAFKNTFAFGLSFGVVPWLTSDGFLKVSGYMTLIEGVLLLAAIPMFIYGERIRLWTLSKA